MPTDAAEMRGRVTDAVTGYGIESAAVLLDLEPADGTNEYLGATGPFGFYTLTGVATGDYATVVEHPGYFPDVATNTFTTGERKRYSVALAPALGGEGGGFDLTIQVRCITTGLQLDGVPFSAIRYATATSAVPDETLSDITDGAGYATMRGMKIGYYRFRANDPADGPVRPYWLAYTTEATPDDKTLVDGPYMAAFSLKPGPLQTVEILVTGHDPAKNAPAPLSGVFVELEGVDPNDPLTTLMPTRSGVTGTNGIVKFKRLPAIGWFATTKSVGYDPAVGPIFPDALGDLMPTNPVPMPIDLKPTAVHVILESEFLHPAMMDGLPVTLTGLTNSRTEGIFRVMATTSPTGLVEAIFTELVPGPYRIAVEGPVMSPPIASMGEWTPNSFFVGYSGSDFVEADDGQTTVQPLPLAVMPATVRLRLFAADEMGALESDLSGDYRDRPIYTPRAQGGIIFTSSAYASPFESANLSVVVTSDVAGEVTFTITPGVYGVKIPGMTNHWGSNADYWQNTNAVIDLGWPFADVWPYGGTYKEAYHSGGLVFDSGQEHRIDLYTRARKMSIQGAVLLDATDPSTFQIIAEPAQSNEVVVFYCDICETGMVSLSSTGGVTTAPLTRMDDANAAEYRFDNVNPGSYTVSVAHSRNTFTSPTLDILPWKTPGEIPAVPPGSAGDYAALQVIDVAGTPYNGIDGIDDIVASYNGAPTLTMHVYAWNTNTTSYDFQFTTTDPQILQPGDFATNRYFSPISPGFVVFTNAYEVWRTFSTNGVYNTNLVGAATVSVYLDGPSDNTTGSAPSITYNLAIRALSADDPTIALSNVTVTLAGGGGGAAPLALPGYAGSFVPTNVSHATWAWPTNSPYTVDILDADDLRLTVTLARGMVVTGVVTNVVGGLPVGLANVTVRDRYGKALRYARSGTNGAFAVASALPAGQTIFVDVDAPGYKAWRQRFGGADVAGVSSNLVVAAGLEPLPPPVIAAAGVNRYGLFLPGVRKSGDQSLYDGFEATNFLTMTWTSVVDMVTVTNILPGFDNPNGSAGALATNVLADDILEVWIVDRRSFPSNIYDDLPEAIAPPPDTNGYLALRGWLAQVDSGVISNVFHQRVSRFASTTGTQVTASGDVRLWALPPGDFDPVFIAVSGRRAFAVKRDFTYPSDLHKLSGVRLPEWMATIANVMGLVAGAQASAQELKAVLPEGRFEALPTFTAVITNHVDGGGPTGFLNYLYEISVKWQEGMETPAGGLISLGPGVLGLTFEGLLNYTLEGNLGASTIGVSATLETEELEGSDMLPAGAFETLEEKGVGVTGKMRVVGSMVDVTNVDTNRPHQHRLTHAVGGGMTSELTVNLTPVLSKIPYVGPVLLTLDETGLLTFNGILDGGVGLRSQTTWETPFPTSVEEGTVEDTTPQVLRRHLLGGSEEATTLFAICYRFGVGLNVDGGGSRFGATGKIILEGTNCTAQVSNTNAVDILPRPSVEVTLNDNFDWPLIKRVRGQVSAEISAFADLWVTRLEKEWKWSVLEFDVQFGTEPAFELIPMTITQTTDSPLTATGGVVFIGSMPTVMQNFYSSGSLALTPGTTNLMIYTDILPGTGMILRASQATDTNAWTAPVDIGVASGMVAVATAPLGAGGWMAVWSEVDTADLADPYPGSTIMYSTSDAAGTTWSVPAPAAALGGVAAELHLLTEGAFTGLLFLETDEGPLGQSFTVKSMTWDGISWTAPAAVPTLPAPLPIFDFSAAVVDFGGPEALIAYTTTTNVLNWLTWDGTSFSAESTLSTNAGTAVSVAAGDDDKFLATWAMEPKGVGLATHVPGSGWDPLLELTTNALPIELSIATLAGTETGVVAWTAGGDPTALWYGFVAAGGTFLSGPSNLTENVTGRYHGPAAFPVSPTSARILSRFTASPTQVREFYVSMGAGSSDPDRDNDGFDDVKELTIVDADPDDAITTIDDVLPGDDFDGDTISNFDECYLGFDPANPDSRFEITFFTMDDGMHLIFGSRDGLPYTLQIATNMLPTNAWSDLKVIVGDGLPVTATDEPVEENLFYRLKTDIPQP